VDRSVSNEIDPTRTRRLVRTQDCGCIGGRGRGCRSKWFEALRRLLGQRFVGFEQIRFLRERQFGFARTDWLLRFDCKRGWQNGCRGLGRWRDLRLGCGRRLFDRGNTRFPILGRLLQRL
jgi:hypothetical protein